MTSKRYQIKKAIICNVLPWSSTTTQTASQSCRRWLEASTLQSY